MQLKAIAMALTALLVLAACNPFNTGPAGRLLVEREMDGETDIYVLNANGSGLTQLTDEPGWDGTAAWSPDGTKIAFASERAGAPAIFVMDADGSNVEQLTDADYPDLMPVWSPDGTRIAFVSSRPYEEILQGGRMEVEAGFELWIMDADGSDTVRITGNRNDQALYPTWSPDGNRVAYMEIDQDVRILAGEARPNAQFTVLSDGLPGRHWTPAWSPDGTQIALMAEVEGENEIWLIRPEGGDAINASDQPTNEGDPAWSPDGKHIAFISDRDGPISLYVMDANGENVRRLTDDDANYSHPNWTAQ